MCMRVYYNNIIMCDKRGGKRAGMTAAEWGHRMYYAYYVVQCVQCIVGVCLYRKIFIEITFFSERSFRRFDFTSTSFATQ